MSSAQRNATVLGTGTTEWGQGAAEAREPGISYSVAGRKSNRSRVNLWGRFESFPSGLLAEVTNNDHGTSQLPSAQIAISLGVLEF